MESTLCFFSWNVLVYSHLAVTQPISLALARRSEAREGLVGAGRSLRLNWFQLEEGGLGPTPRQGDEDGGHTLPGREPGEAMGLKRAPLTLTGLDGRRSSSFVQKSIGLTVS